MLLEILETVAGLNRAFHSASDDICQRAPTTNHSVAAYENVEWESPSCGYYHQFKRGKNVSVAATNFSITYLYIFILADFQTQLVWSDRSAKNN
jgi:hypothetical protein